MPSTRERGDCLQTSPETPRPGLESCLCAGVLCGLSPRLAP